MTKHIDTDMTDAWIDEFLKKNPCVATKTKDGELTGNIRTCPVRLSFPFLFEPQEPMEKGGKPKFSTTLLFPVGADLTLLKVEAERVIKEKSKTMAGMHVPFRDGSEKPQFAGYDEGVTFFTASTINRPPVVTTSLSPILEPELVYPGVWALVTLRAFYFEAKNPTGAIVKKGASFGLQNVMIVANDKRLGGGGSNPADDFAGVQIAPAMDLSSVMGE